MMKVKFIHSTVINDTPFGKKHTYDLPDELALKLINHGSAQLAEEQVVEVTEVVEKTKKTTTKKKTK